MIETSSVKVRLIHDGKQPGPSVSEPVDFGIQDKMGAIHAGNASKGRLLLFEIDIAVKHADALLFSLGMTKVVDRSASNSSSTMVSGFW